MQSNDKYKCRVCGLDQFPDLPWGEDGITPSHNICACCGVEFGYEDSGADVEHLARLRSDWVRVRKSNWFSPEFKPANWEIAAQFTGIPETFAHPDDRTLVELYYENKKRCDEPVGFAKLSRFEH